MYSIVLKGRLHNAQAWKNYERFGDCPSQPYLTQCSCLEELPKGLVISIASLIVAMKFTQPNAKHLSLIMSSFFYGLV